MNDTIIPDKSSAEGYDQQARETNWFGTEVVFGLVYPYINAGETLIDLGIGSGLSSVLFHRAGLQIYGLDGSQDILDVCAAKGLTVDLKQHDLRKMPFPYPPNHFNHAISVAVLNSFQDLGPLFADVARIIRQGGIFAFTVEDQKPGQDESYPINRVEVDELPDPETAVRLFRHRRDIIHGLLRQNGFTPLKELEFVAFSYPAEQRDVFFRAYVAQKR